MGSIMGSQKIMGSDYGNNISESNGKSLETSLCQECSLIEEERGKIYIRIFKGDCPPRITAKNVT